MTKHFLFVFTLLPFLCFAQTEVKLHPAQIGGFGAGSGDFLRFNIGTGGGAWESASSLRGSLLLPTGSINQTLRHDGSNWVANSGLSATTNRVGIGTSSPAVTLDIVHPGNDAFMRLVGYDSKLTIGGTGAGGEYTRSAIFVIESESAGIRETATKIIPSSRSTALFEYFGAEVTNNFYGNYGIVRTQSGYPFYTQAWSAGNQFTYGYINKPNTGDAFTPSDMVQILNINSGGTKGIDVLGRIGLSGPFVVAGSTGTAGHLYASGGSGAGSYVSPASVVTSGGGLTTSTTFSGDVSGTYDNLQINVNAVSTAEIANNAITSTKIADGSVTTTDLSNTGVSSGTYGSATQVPVVIVGSDGRIISASNTAISSTNIYNTNGTIPASETRTVTMGDAATLLLDASANSTTPITPFIIKGGPLAGTATRFLEVQNNVSASQFRGTMNSTNVTLSSTTLPVDVSGSTYSRISSGSGTIQANSGGFISMNLSTSDPGSPTNGGFWMNNTDYRLKTRLNSTTYTAADLERDFVGDAVSARSASFTMPAQQFYTVADANGAAFTITFDATMREGIDYVIECRRNGTNAITFDAGSGYNLAVDTISTFPDDGAVAMGGAGTGIQAAHKVYYVRRHGTNISVK